jgi:hypothetical protein
MLTFSSSRSFIHQYQSKVVTRNLHTRRKKNVALLACKASRGSSGSCLLLLEASFGSMIGVALSALMSYTSLSHCLVKSVSNQPFSMPCSPRMTMHTRVSRAAAFVFACRTSCHTLLNVLSWQKCRLQVVEEMIERFGTYMMNVSYKEMNMRVRCLNTPKCCALAWSLQRRTRRRSSVNDVDESVKEAIKVRTVVCVVGSRRTRGARVFECLGCQTWECIHQMKRKKAPRLIETNSID